jgi:hypothetical protein
MVLDDVAGGILEEGKEVRPTAGHEGLEAE